MKPMMVLKERHYLFEASELLEALAPYVHGGQAELKALITEGEWSKEAIRSTAINEGFHAEEDSHEIEGQHMITLTWHF